MRSIRIAIALIPLTIAGILSYLLYFYYLRLILSETYEGYYITIYEHLFSLLIFIVALISITLGIKILIVGNDLKELIDNFFNSLFNGLINIIFIASFFGAIVSLGTALITPESFFPHLEGNKLFSSAIFLSVCLAGFLGGYVREIFSYIVSLKESKAINLKNNFWQIVFSITSSLFISLIFFLLLRAGILKSDKIDSFNIYGITGVSAVTGYFTDKIIERVSKLYKLLLDKKTNTFYK